MALENSYQITYNALGGTGAPSATTGTYSVLRPAVYTVTLKSGTPTRTGYDFLGWATSIGATSPQYGAGSSYSFNADGNPHYGVLYAVWKAKTYTVTYKPGANGTGSQQTDTKTYDVALTLKGAIFTRSGYKQVGWATSDGGSKVYDIGGSYTANAAVTLYPVWEATVSTFTITNSVPADGSTQGTVTITRYSTSYTHTVKITLGTRSQTFTNIGTSKTFTIPAAWVDQIPAATSAVATVEVTTYNGSTALGKTTKSFTITVPASVKPTVSISGTNQSDNSTVSGWNTLVQGYSKIKLTATAAAGTGSTISTIVFSGEGVSQSGTGTTVTSSLLKNAGSKTWKVTVTDARGRSASATLTRTIYEYFPASILSLTAVRANSTGTASPMDGTYIKATGVYSFASCNGHNSATVKKIEYKRHTTSTWSTGQSSATSGTAYTFGAGDISILYNYDVRLTVTDALGSTAVYTVNVSSVAGVSFGLNGQCARFGGPVQYPDRFECDWNAQFDKVVDVVQRRADATLSRTGWYNIIKFSIGSATSVKFATAQALNIKVGSTYNNISNCVHAITMLGTWNTNPRFIAELSRSNVNVIDKIRYRYDANNNGWVDVHYTASSSNDVWMMFDVSAYNTTQQHWVAQNFTAVEDAPSTDGTADTIMTTYSFMEATGASISFTPTTGSAYSTYGNCWFAKYGHVVHVHIGISGLTANTSTTIGTLPEGFRPKVLTVATGNGSAISNLARARISAAGVITVYSASTTALIDVIFICAL